MDSQYKDKTVDDPLTFIMGIPFKETQSFNIS